MTPLRLVLLLLLLLPASPGWAQSPCPSDDLSRHPGSWQPRAGYGGASQFAAKPGSYDRGAAEATLNTLLSLIRAAYPEPRGGVAYFTPSLLFSSPYRNHPFGYSLNIGHTYFMCTMAGQVVESIETGTYINVDVNRLTGTSLFMPVSAPEVQGVDGPVGLHRSDDGEYLINGRPAFTVPSAVTPSRGVEVFTNDRGTSDGEPPLELRYLIRRPDVPLFTYVTRGEYVEQFRRELVAHRTHGVEIQRHLAKLTGQSTESDEAVFVRDVDAYLRAVDAYLETAAEDERRRPFSELLPLFPRDNLAPAVEFREGPFHIVTFNPDYLDRTLPLHVPQFIVVELAAPVAYAWQRDFRQQVSERLDFDVIRGLLLK